MSYVQTFIPNPAHLARAYREYATIERELQSLATQGGRSRVGRQAARAAILVRQSYVEFEEGLNAAAAKTAAVANAEITRRYIRTRVRPSTGTGVHLVDALGTSVPIKAALPTGAVGIIDRDRLDEFVYWPSQEFGSDRNVPPGVTYRVPHLVGRRLVGMFHTPGGYSPPDATEFRYHALFEGVMSRNDKGAIITNPIPEGRFIRGGRDVAYKVWTQEMDKAVVKAGSRLNAIMGRAYTAPLPTSAPLSPTRVSRKRGFSSRYGPRGFRPI